MPTKEAHNQSLTAAVLHGIFLAIALWAILMVTSVTPRPDPGLLVVLCVVVPAFLFVGQHLYLGLINIHGEAAATYPDKPLGNPVGWVIIAVATALVCGRAYMLIPASYWPGG